jgi:hypothetical protein
MLTREQPRVAKTAVAKLTGLAGDHCPIFHVNRTSDESPRGVVGSVADMKLLLVWNVAAVVVAETLLQKAIVPHPETWATCPGNEEVPSLQFQVLLLQCAKAEYATMMLLANAGILLLGEKDKPARRLLALKREDPDHQGKGLKSNALQLQLRWTTNGAPKWDPMHQSNRTHPHPSPALHPPLLRHLHLLSALG